MEQSPPYALNQAQLGGLPTVADDVPPLVVFLILFSVSALVSVYLLERHRQKYHRLSTIGILLFLFAGERVLTCVLRIAWAYRLLNIRIAVAAQVFVQAGALLLYLMNVLLAKRIWIDQIPGVKVYQRLRAFLGALSACTVSILVVIVTSIIVSVYTLDQSILNRCRAIQRAGATYILAFAAVPIPLLLVTQCLSNARPLQTMSFKPPAVPGSARSKMAFVGFSSLLCLVNAGFKAGVIWTPARTLFDPAWYHSKDCLYTFVFGTELCVLLLCFVARADLLVELEKEEEPELLAISNPTSCNLLLE